MSTKIQWTDETWNPTTGCTKISPGCAHCYIERTPAFRIAGNRFVHGKTDIAIFHDRLEQPLHWRKPRRVFVNSLSDLFHEDISDAFIDRVFAVMALAPQHTFQVLTKRPARMHAYFAAREREWTDGDESRAWWGCGHAIETVDEWLPDGAWTNAQRDQIEENPLPPWPLPNVWLGVSVENQHFADDRIPQLLQTPAAVRFISAEPLLGPIQIQPYMPNKLWNDLPSWKEPELDWVIDGAESGPGARDYRMTWSTSLQQQCAAAGVAYFRKQVGRHPIVDDLTHWRGAAALLPDRSGYRLTLTDKKGGDPAEWPLDLRVRESPVFHGERLRQPRGVSDPMTVIDLSDWLTKAQAASAIGVSTKQVERLQHAGKLEQRGRPQDRGPNLVVYNPDDVARIASERHPAPTPFVLPAGTHAAPTNGNGRPSSGTKEALARVPSDSGIKNIPGDAIASEQLQALVALALRTVLSQTSETARVSPALYVTLKDAAAISGLSQAYLRRLIDASQLPAIRDRGWRIRRKDLEAL